MNTKTLISALALTLTLGTLALPGTASARDYGNDRGHQEQSRDHRDRDDNRRHDNDRGRYERDRYESRRHDNGNHYGQIRWIPYYPQYRPVYRGYTSHHYGGNYDPNTIIRIETQW